MLLYSSFVTGLQEPIKKWSLKEGYKPRLLLDGAIIYDSKKTDAPLPCFFNTFTVLEQINHKGKTPIEQLMKKVLKSPPKFKRGRGSFRLVTSNENKLVSVDKVLRSNVELLIKRHTGMTVERRGGGTEFWFLSRSEGVSLFMERNKAPKQRTLKQGELRPELAYCLNRLSEPKPSDVMLDPFCGYGAICKSRSRHFPYKQIYGLDNDTAKIHDLSAKPGRIKYIHSDIRNISGIIKPNSVNSIVTDPPWGFYGNEEDTEPLYKVFAKEAAKLIKDNGSIIVLTAQKDLMKLHLKQGVWADINLDAAYDILVSGKKAAVFVLRKPLFPYSG